MPYSHIQWPEGLDEARFLAEYWQQKPLLIRQALPDFETPLPADELAGLSLEPETTPRLITQDGTGAYHLEHGPFEADRFETLTGNDWSLLVTDVEKHLPDILHYLQPFGFLPGWRIDDLMISYAPLGASVGAHIDEYDVFLLQASGARRWSIEAPAAASYELVPDSELKLLSSFKATDTWELEAGDLLYLPPGVPHHGVASAEPCTTWSIGFRAPTTADFVMRMAEMICEKLPKQRYTDAPLTPATPGEIDGNALARFADIWNQAIGSNKETLAMMTGQFLTESANVSNTSRVDDDESLDSFADDYWQAAPFSRFAWRSLSDDNSDNATVQLFVDGEAHQCSRRFAIELCRAGNSINSTDHQLSTDDATLLRQLAFEGSLMRQEDEE
ncbi:cupin domain-containing protein [Granulosicoccus antarcticus]|uniref:50S ribosomal protein L16 3-hydroxylase n=1 Tax=Granulosicoccus antarcticus IMCC3135 TaxID=1192854 RepID=A0A2Z2NTW4_9GAMM|nr:cupin domain-containing protein [Granulosicoccus antarcticus]ASJ75002.1 50S ribosomal protein L16 3-hydroxylase [Granulosicoccus antarcticus IMCC3135]